MVLQATELMHNDWYSGLNASNERDSFQFDIYDLEFWGDCEPQPIPLTPEILKANGFEDDRNDCVGTRIKTSTGTNIDIVYHQKGKILSVIEWIGEIQVPRFCNIVRYVHKYQHALRLCGFSALADNFKIK